MPGPLGHGICTVSAYAERTVSLGAIPSWSRKFVYMQLSFPVRVASPGSGEQGPLPLPQYPRMDRWSYIQLAMAARVAAVSTYHTLHLLPPIFCKLSGEQSSHEL